MRIAVDIPPELIERMKKVDTSKLTEQQIDKWYQQGSALLQRFPKFVRPLNDVEMKEINIPGIPQNIANLLSRINYSKLNQFTKMTAKTIMDQWIKNNLPMRN